MFMDFVTFLSQLYGKGRETAQKLRSAGYTTPEKLSRATPSELSAVTGLPLASSRGIAATARGMLQEHKKGRKKQLVEIEGVGQRRAKRLQEAGLRTVRAVAGTNEEKLARVLKVQKSTAGRIIKSAKRVKGRAPRAGVTAEETKAITTEVLPQKSRTKERPKASAKSVNSFWQFG
jgi:predicted flap endonuclease-1-like 5' DNA nuclease